MNQPSPYGPQPAYPPAQQPPQQPSFPQPSYQPAPGMIPPKVAAHHHPWILIILLVVFVLGFLGSSGFAMWAYGQMQDYKNNVNEKVVAAVEVAVENTKQSKEAEFLERSKSPYKKYVGPGTFGSLEITYPKTWSATVDTSPNSSPPVNGYFHPNYVPGPDSDTAFALRVEVVEQPYDRVMATYDNDAQRGRVKISPFKAKRVPSVLGARVNGEIDDGLSGSAVVFPLRDKTIKIYVESQSFMKDFNKIILPNLLFSP